MRVGVGVAAEVLSESPGSRCLPLGQGCPLSALPGARIQPSCSLTAAALGQGSGCGTILGCVPSTGTGRAVFSGALSFLSYCLSPYGRPAPRPPRARHSHRGEVLCLQPGSDLLGPGAESKHWGLESGGMGGQRPSPLRAPRGPHHLGPFSGLLHGVLVWLGPGLAARSEQGMV